MTEMLLWLTMTVFFEARGEETHCQVKVAQVVLNRTKSTNDIVKTITAKGQFSWVPDVLHNGVMRKQYSNIPFTPQWARAEQAAITALYSNSTFPPTHFHSTSIRKPLGWSNLTYHSTCGNHVFYV